MTNLISLPTDGDRLHMAERYQTIMRAFLSTYNMSKAVLPDTSYLKNKALSLLNHTKGYSVALAFRGTAKNFYPMDKAAKTIKELNNKINASFYLLGTKDSYQDSESIIDACKEINMKNLCGKTDLLELKAVP